MPTIWAVYTGTSKYGTQGISLHRTRRDALVAVFDYLCIGHDGDPAYDENAVADLDDDGLADRLQDLADQDGSDWHVEEVLLPAPARRRTSRPNP